MVLNKESTPTIPRILLVEDSEDLRFLLSAVLETIPAEVLTAADGRRAIESISSPQAFDLVLMDMRLPDLSGEETFSRIRMMDQCPPVVALTGDILGGDEDSYRRKGFAGFLPKGFGPKKLKEDVAALLKEL